MRSAFYILVGGAMAAGVVMIGGPKALGWFTGGILFAYAVAVSESFYRKNY